jgi:hypothetical protein
MIRKAFFDAAGPNARGSEFEEYCPCYTDGHTSQAQVGGEDYSETRKQGIQGKSEISRKERLAQAEPGSCQGVAGSQGPTYAVANCVESLNTDVTRNRKLCINLIFQLPLFIFKPPLFLATFASL